MEFIAKYIIIFGYNALYLARAVRYIGASLNWKSLRHWNQFLFESSF